MEVRKIAGVIILTLLILGSLASATLAEVTITPTSIVINDETYYEHSFTISEKATEELLNIDWYCDLYSYNYGAYFLIIDSQGTELVKYEKGRIAEGIFEAQPGTTYTIIINGEVNDDEYGGYAEVVFRGTDNGTYVNSQSEELKEAATVMPYNINWDEDGYVNNSFSIPNYSLDEFVKVTWEANTRSIISYGYFKIVEINENKVRTLVYIDSKVKKFTGSFLAKRGADYKVIAEGGEDSDEDYGSVIFNVSYNVRYDFNLYDFYLYGPDTSDPHSSQMYNMYLPSVPGYYEADRSRNFNKINDAKPLTYQVYVFWDMKMSNKIDRIQTPPEFRLGYFENENISDEMEIIEDTKDYDYGENGISGIFILPEYNKIMVHAGTGDTIDKGIWDSQDHDSFKIDINICHTTDTIPPFAPGKLQPLNGLTGATYNGTTKEWVAGLDEAGNLVLKWEAAEDDGPLLKDFVDIVKKHVAVNEKDRKLQQLINTGYKTISGINNYRLYIEDADGKVQKFDLFADIDKVTADSLYYYLEDNEVRCAIDNNKVQLKPNQKYKMWITAIDRADLEGKASETFVVTIDHGVAAPKLTVNPFTVIAKQEKGQTLYDVTFSWNEVTDISGVTYETVLSKRNDELYEDDLRGITDTSKYTFTNLPAATNSQEQYYAWVRAKDGVGFTSDWVISPGFSLYSAMAQITEIIPRATIVEGQPQYQMELTFQDVATTAYNLERRANAESPWVKLATLSKEELAQTGYIYIDQSDLEKHGQYFYRLTTINSLGAASQVSYKAATIPNLEVISCAIVDIDGNVLIDKITSEDGSYTFSINPLQDIEGDQLKFRVAYEKTDGTVYYSPREGFSSQPETVRFNSVGQWQVWLEYLEYHDTTAVSGIKVTNKLEVSVKQAADVGETPNSSRGELTGDEIWNGTHYLHETVIVPRGITLTIMPGTEIIADQDSKLEIYGNLIVDAAEIGITFRGNDGASWQGIMLNTSASLKQLTINDAKRGLIVTGAAMEISLNNCSFEGNEVGLHIYDNSPTVQDCQFKNNYFYGIKEDSNSHPLVKDCRFINNGINYYHETLTEMTLEELNEQNGNSGNR